MYHLPLLPGYGPNTNLRSSAPAKLPTGKSMFTRLSEAEEDGYQGMYFPAPRSTPDLHDGYISSNSPVQTRKARREFTSENQSQMGFTLDLPPTPTSEQPFMSLTDTETEPETEAEAETATETERQLEPVVHFSPLTKPQEEDVAEVVFFEYGVIVFFGLEEGQERDIIEDIAQAGIMRRGIPEAAWEIEECHFAVSWDGLGFGCFGWSLTLCNLDSTTVIFHTPAYTMIFSVRRPSFLRGRY